MSSSAGGSRRSLRARPAPRSQPVAEPEADDEAVAGEWASSGSDFEDDLKKVRVLGPGRRARASEPVSSEDEDEAMPPNRAQPTRVVPKKKLLARAATPPPSSLVPVVPGHLGSQLELSSSSSSEDDEAASQRQPPPEPIIEAPRTPSPAQKKAPKKRRTRTEALVESQLLNLAQSCSQADSQPWQKLDSPQPTSSSVDPLSASKYAQEVAEALALGGEALTGSEEEDEAMDTVHEEPPPQVGTQNIEVTLALPETKRKRKAFDMEKYVQREINRVRKETQLWMHQTHILCLFAHLRYFNMVLSDPLLVGTLLSLIPEANSFPHAKLTPLRLSRCLEWFQTVFQFQEDAQRAVDFPWPYQKHLLHLVEKGRYTCNEELVFLFLIVTKAQKWPSRLVMNLNPVALKPDKSNMELSTKKIKTEVEDIKPDPGQVGKDTESMTESPKLEISQKSPPKKISHTSTQNNGAKKPAKRGTSNTPKKTEISTSSTKTKKAKKPAQKDTSIKEEIAKTPTRSSRKSSKGSRQIDCPEEESTASETSKKSTKVQKGRKPAQASVASDSKNKTKDREDSSNRKSTRDARGSGRDKQSKPTAMSARDHSPIRKQSKTRSGRSSKRPKYEESDDEEAEEESEDESPLKAVKSQRTSKRAKDESPQPKKLTKKAVGEAKRRQSSSLKDLIIKTEGSSSESEFSSMSKRKTLPEKKPASTSKKASQSSSKFIPVNYWVEILIENKWECVDVVRRKVGTAMEMEDRCSKPMMYVIGCDGRGQLKDVTKRYAKNFMTHNRKLRVDQNWFAQSINRFAPPKGALDDLENEHIEQSLQSMPIPTTGGPKWDKMTSSVVSGTPLDLFGKWQTEVYMPPPAVDGKVPRNEYGNVELFQPWMLPKGTVHIPIKGISRLAYKLKIDCAPAMMGWDSTCGWPKPILEGSIVCEEFQEILMDAWNTDQEEKAKRDEEKREKRVLDNWKKLIKGMLIVQRLKENGFDGGLGLGGELIEEDESSLDEDELDELATLILDVAEAAGFFCGTASRGGESDSAE
eukprot:maker-scaffold60_size442463-snap-gene-3.29 protein:Tk12085 transcript:maker-scaffold60_size442463-snap-gene-3.29-mRNA-1 annotation:"dna repair protein complementing xp-c cells-like protein"